MARAVAKDKWARTMRRDWDERARRDAFHYTTWRIGRRWDPETYFASGERDYLLFVEPLLNSVGMEPKRSTMLELGCGVGRMTRSFASRFAHIHAMDISPEMIARAKALNRGLANVTWHLADGFDLQPLQDGQMDFAFSFLVFQHVPLREIVMGNIGEMLRVLKPGGLFLLQYNGDAAPAASWKGRLIWGVLDRWRVPLLPGLFKVDVQEAGKTWDGAILDPDEVARCIQSHNGTVIGSRGAGTPAAWCWGIRH